MKTKDSRIPEMCLMLFFTFLVFKLTNTVNWSWWWVTSPLWFPLGLGFIILVLAWSVGFIGGLLSGHEES